jgi:hypothetical protein
LADVQRILIVLGMAAAVAGCGGAPRFGPAAPRERDVERTLMLGYDANSDGVVTSAELDTGLKAEFQRADANRDGRLSADEAEAENQRRWAAAGPAASPVLDWNQDGVVDESEFEATPRSLFAELDTDHDNSLSAQELSPIRQRTPDEERRRLRRRGDGQAGQQGQQGQQGTGYPFGPGFPPHPNVF